MIAINSLQAIPSWPPKFAVACKSIDFTNGKLRNPVLERNGESMLKNPSNYQIFAFIKNTKVGLMVDGYKSISHRNILLHAGIKKLMLKTKITVWDVKDLRCMGSLK